MIERQRRRPQQPVPFPIRRRVAAAGGKGDEGRARGRLLAVNHSPTGVKPDGGLPERHEPSLPRSGRSVLAATTHAMIKAIRHHIPPVRVFCWAQRL
jgi:hypothetical protein